MCPKVLARHRLLVSHLDPFTDVNRASRHVGKVHMNGSRRFRFDQRWLAKALISAIRSAPVIGGTSQSLTAYPPITPLGRSGFGSSATCSTISLTAAHCAISDMEIRRRLLRLVLISFIRAPGLNCTSTI